MMTAILILNWNNYLDTIECLKSLMLISDSDFFVVLGDNGSTNGSISKIEEFLCKCNFQYNIVSSNDDVENVGVIRSRHIILCDLKVNNGFSKGNNILLRIASLHKPDYYLLLNNDTVVTPNFLSALLNFQKSKPEYSILTPLIYYYANKNKIWNAGGKLKFGFRRYYYSDCEDKSFIKGQYIPCTFLTGCALFVSSRILNNENTIFTERFFFGEEDFEFSMRQHRAGNKMACVCDSIIYHKVSASSKNHSNLSKIFIYYINRFVDMKLHLTKSMFIIWKCIYVPYILFLLINRNLSFKKCYKFLTLLISESKRLSSVDKLYFEEIMSSDFL